MEAADTVRIPHNTAKSRLFYGLRRLRTALVAQVAAPTDH
jgi:DNA-directed RNA polymerase specialized sigma24 family protein